MVRLLRTDAENRDFAALVKDLDIYLAEKDGEEHSFYNQFNQIDRIKYAVVAYEDETALGCGAIKAYDAKTMEIKRMYVSPEARNNGIATSLLSALENWATELGSEKCILETGRRQPEAVSFYKRNGYKLIPNYGQYAGMQNSVCFEKRLSK